MPATARLIVMMEPEDKRKLVASARAQKVSLAKLVRQRLVASVNPDEQVFLEAIVDLGAKARRVFAEAEEAEAREATARTAQPAREAALKARVKAAFEAARTTRHERTAATTARGAARRRQ